MERDLIREIKGKTVKINVAFSDAGVGGATVSRTYEGIVVSGASYGSDHFMVLENGTMINIRYVQTIE